MEDIKLRYNPKTAFGDPKLIELLNQAQDRHEYLERTKVCPDCGGEGEEECDHCGRSGECRTCDGKGRIDKN